MKINEEDIRNLCKRFETMLEQQEHTYFEPDEIDIIADYYEQELQHDMAIKVLTYGLSLFPDNEMFLLRQARCQVWSGLLDEAADTLRHITEHGIEYHFVCAEHALFDGNSDEAIVAFRRIIDMEESTIEDCIDILDTCSEIGRVDILETLSPHIDSRYADATLYWRELALEYDDIEDYDKVVALYNKILDTNPFSADDWFSLAKVQIRNGNGNAAIEAVDFAIAIEENFDEHYALKGYCYLILEQYDEALKQYFTYLNLTTNKDVAHELIANAYSYKELNEKSVEHLLQAISYNDKNPNLYYQLGTHYRFMGENERAIECMYKAVSCDDNDHEAHVMLGELLFFKDNYEEAYKHLKHLDIYPLEDTLHGVILADVCIRLQRYDEAVELLPILIEQEPYEAQLYYDIILCYMQLGDYDTAAQWLVRTEAVATDTDAIAEIDERSRKVWTSIRERINKLRNILKLYLKKDF